VKFLVLPLLTFILSIPAIAADSNKIEGSCTGNLSNGTTISYSYYSDYDGCKKISSAAVSFTAGLKGYFKGTRSFTESQDIYTLNDKYKLMFNNSTGNTSGILVTPSETVKVQCKIRDYEYPDC
jgi:hypothetical protein